MIFEEFFVCLSFMTNLTPTISDIVHSHQHSCNPNLLLTIKVKTTCGKADGQESKQMPTQATANDLVRKTHCVWRWSVTFSQLCGNKQGRKRCTKMATHEWKNVGCTRIKSEKKKNMHALGLKHEPNLMQMILN